MYTVLTFRPEYQYPLYIVVRVRVLRFCARVKARFSVRVFGLKKLFWNHTTRTNIVFAALHRQPRCHSGTEITNKNKTWSLQRYYIK